MPEPEEIPAPRIFGEMLTKLRGQELPAWIAAVCAEGLPGLTAFADSLTSDLDAVTRGADHAMELRTHRGVA